MSKIITDNDFKLLEINGVWVKNPDADSWGPIHNPQWTSSSGRVLSGKFVGARQYFKWSLPLTWSMLEEEEFKKIAELAENGKDFLSVKFYHYCKYISITCYSGTLTPLGIENTDSGIYYSKVTLDLVEQ